MKEKNTKLYHLSFVLSFAERINVMTFYIYELWHTIKTTSKAK
jgi:hypothetical protein